MKPDPRRVRLLVALGLCLGLLTSCHISDDCLECVLECTVTATTPVAWTEQTALGSPAQLFSSFEGTCQAPLRWDASGWSSALTVTPPRGQSTITATVALNPASARLVTHTPASACPDTLQIDGVATLDLPEGKVADSQPFTLSASAAMPPTTLSFSVKEGDLGPWVSIRKSDPAGTVSMPITIRGAWPSLFRPNRPQHPGRP